MQKHKAVFPLSPVKYAQMTPKITLTDSIMPESFKIISTSKSVITKENNPIDINGYINLNNKESFEIYKRISSKETRDIKRNIEDIQKKSKMIQSLKRSFIIKPFDTNIDLVNQSLLMDKEKIKKKIMEKDMLLNNYKKHLIKQKSNSTCLNEYFSIESNLVHVHHDKLMVDNEYNTVCKRNKELFDDTNANSNHNQIKEVELNKKMLNRIKLVMRKHNSNKRITNEEQSVGLLTGVGIGGIANIMTQDSAIMKANRSLDNTNILYSLSNNKSCFFKEQLGEKRKINLKQLLLCQSEKKIKRSKYYDHSILNQDIERKKENSTESDTDKISNRDIDKDKDKNRDENKDKDRDKDTDTDKDIEKDKDVNIDVNHNSNNKYKRDVYNQANLCKEIILKKYNKLKKEIKNEERRLFNNRIFSREQIESILCSKRHLKINQIKQLFIKVNKSDGNTSSITKTLQKSMSTPTVNLPHIKENYHHHKIIFDKLTKALDVSTNPIRKLKLSDFTDFTGLVKEMNCC